MKSNTSVREEDLRRFPDRYLDSVKSSDGRVLQTNRTFGRTFVIALPAVLISRFRTFAAILPTSPTLGRQKRLAARVGLLNAKSVILEAGRPQQVARTRWFTLQNVLEAVAHACANSDGYIQPLVRPAFAL